LGIEALHAFLSRHRQVALDTSVFLYHAQAHPKYSRFTLPVFSWLEKPGGHAVTSTVTLTELLVQPLRAKDENLVGVFFALLAKYTNLEWISVSVQIAALGARYRADFGLRAPDAIQGATCIYSRISSLLTNDPVFKRIPELDLLVLDEML
jgi:predicted nucleic acid-binding protein